MAAVLPFYREKPPGGGAAAELAVSYWEFLYPAEASVPFRHEIFPDGCISLFYQRQLIAGTSLLAFSGISVRSAVRDIYPGELYWAIRISPAAGRAVLNADPADFIDKPVLAGEMLGGIAEELKVSLDGAIDLEQASGIFDSFLAENGWRQMIDPVVAAAVEKIGGDGAHMSIDQLAAATGLGRRQFERRFRVSSGLTPKQYIRIRRLRSTAVFLVEGEKSTWADRAAEMGFADQSHLTHEFTSLTNRSPKQFASKVKDIRHGPLVK